MAIGTAHGYSAVKGIDRYNLIIIMIMMMMRASVGKGEEGKRAGLE